MPETTTPYDPMVIDTRSNAPVRPSTWQASQERLRREDAATPGDYVGSIWRQDGLVDGLMGDIVGRQMTPKPGYFAGTDPNYKDLEDGVWDDHKKYLYDAVSPEHAQYIKGRLLQKQEDLVRLGDMGVKGNIGRLALNVLFPDQLLMGMAGGWVAGGARALQLAKASKVARAAAAAEEVAAAGKGSAIAAGIGAGAVENAAYEKLRQSVNFEDDTAGVLEAGLIGAAFTAPFAWGGARSARRVANAAAEEREILGLLKKHEEGTALAPHELQKMDEVVKIHESIRELEAGRIDPDTFNERMDAFHGPVEPVDVWAQRHADRLRSEVDAFIQENFPNRNGTAKSPVVSPEERAKMDARVAREDQQFLQPEQPAPEQPRKQGPDAPLETAMQSAFRKALDERQKKLTQADLAERKRLEQSGLMDAQEAEKARAKEDAWRQAQKDMEAQRRRQEEQLINAREEARWLGQEDTLGDTPPEPAPVQAPDHTQWVGQEVSWAGPEGETLEGTVVHYNPELGKLIVKTDEGMRNVAPQHLDQYAGPAPSGFLPGSVGAAQVQKIANIANQRTAMSQARMDFFAILNRSENEVVRELVFKLAKDAIQVDKSEAQGWTASEYKKQLQRQVGGLYHVALEEAFQDAVKLAGVGMLERGKFKEQFMELVSRETRGDAYVRAHHPTIHPAVAKAAGAMKEAYAKLLAEAQKAGVKGAQGVAPNDLYVNRIWHHDRIREAINKHGEDAVVDLLARAIQVPGLIGDRGKAKRFLDTVRRLEFNTALQNVHLQGRDMGTLRGELKAYGLAERDINDIVDVLFDARAASGSDAGQAGNLKFRFDFDETAAQNLKTGVLRLQDLFENDARVVMDTYINSMGGHIGLAKVGIDSQATWMAALKRAEDEAVAKGLNGKDMAKELQYLQDIHANITGRPMSTADFSYTARTMAAVRGYTRSVMLGQLGLTAAFEMNRAVSLVGFKAMWGSMPSLGNFIRALRQGYIPEKGLARDIMDMTGFGTEMASSYARQHELESGFVGGTLTRFERGANKMSHFTDVISGNASFTSITRQLTAMGVTREAIDVATGTKKLTQKMRERWVGQGLDEVEIDAVMKDLKDHAVMNNGNLEGLRYEDWARDEPETYQKFQLFLQRQVRDAIQDHDIGETMPFMHTTIGKMLAELKTFMLVAHAKNFLKQAHYRDATAVQMWAIAMLSESLAYSVQAAVNYPGQLDEKLTPENIAKAAFARASINGLMPMALEAGYTLLSGGDSLFQEGSTANTDNRVPWKTPTYILATRSLNALPDLAGGLLGTGNVTQSEFKDAWRALPMARLYGLPALGNYLAESFPKSGPKGDD